MIFLPKRMLSFISFVSWLSPSNEFAPGMAITRSMTRKRNHDASTSKRSNAPDHDGSGSWSDLHPDLLFLVMMRLGLIEFLSFSKVCHSWRSLALSNRKDFMASRKPLLISPITDPSEKVRYLDDLQGGEFTTVIVPNSSNRTCVGLTCGYLIMFGKQTHDFLLVNPITNHEFRFPCLPQEVRFPFLPSDLDTDPTMFRATLVYSSSMSGWVFVITLQSSKTISFSLANEQTRWFHIESNSAINDLHAFKEKVYTIDIDKQLSEVRFDPEPTLMPLKMKNVPKLYRALPLFVSSDEKLYVVGYVSDTRYVGQEVGLDEMKWVPASLTIGQYAVFLSDVKCCAAIRPETWTEPETTFERFAYVLSTYDNSVNPIGRNERWLGANMWYFPHDCLHVNQPQE